MDANPSCPAACPCHLLSLLHRPHRTALRLVMILGQFLPALLLAFNPQGDTVSFETAGPA